MIPFTVVMVTMIIIGGLGRDIFTCGKGNDVVHDFIELEGDSVNDDCETIIS